MPNRPIHTARVTWTLSACALALAALMSMALSAPVYVRAPVVLVFALFAPGAVLAVVVPAAPLAHAARWCFALVGSVVVQGGVALLMLYTASWNPNVGVGAVAVGTLLAGGAAAGRTLRDGAPAPAGGD